MNNYNIIAMKKVLFCFTILLLIPIVNSEAQTSNLEKLNSYKIGFFTKKLDLTSDEAVKFWPVYNEYQTQRNLLQVEKLKINRNLNQNESSLSDKQLVDMGDKYVDLLVQESNLSVELHKKLKEVLPPAKVIRYYQAENQYKAQLLNELQNVKQEQKLRPARRLN